VLAAAVGLDAEVGDRVDPLVQIGHALQTVVAIVDPESDPRHLAHAVDLCVEARRLPDDRRGLLLPSSCARN
jgi:hypothetical protein